MDKYYSPSTKGFYPKATRDSYGEAFPADAVEVTSDQERDIRAALGNAGAVSIQGGVLVIVAQPVVDLDATKDTLLRAIDRTADTARLAVAGDPLRAAEYQIAEAEAKAYQAAGYTGECPPSVKSWAEAKNWTSKQAADNISAEATAWNAALYAIRDARLKAKEAVRNALTADAAAAIATTAIDGINAKVANLGNAAS